MISAKVVADTYYAGSRLTTLELVYPRSIHSELMTHRVFSRNAASSRAIPVAKMIEAIRDDPAMPTHWGKNQPGMAAGEELSPEVIAKCKDEILRGAEHAIELASNLTALGCHKQISNRYLEPFMHIQTLVSATRWTNFFHLRTAGGAEPHFQDLAEAALEAMNTSSPLHVSTEGVWHLPYVTPEELGKLKVKNARKVSVARCARISYTKHGQIKDLQDDIQRHDDMVKFGHWSPFEHVAETCLGEFANFDNFRQYRYGFLEENVEEFPRLLDPFRDEEEEQSPDNDGENDDYV